MQADRSKSPRIPKILTIIVTGVLLFCACSVESPKAPSWDMPLNIPLANKQYFANELVKGKDDLIIMESGLLGFQITGEVDTTTVGDHLHLPDVVDSTEITLNDLKISSVLTGTDQFLFSRLYANAETAHGSRAVVAPFSFKNVKGSKLQNNDFDFADILAGHARITIHNLLPVDLHNVRLYLYNQVNDVIITELDVIPVLPASDSLVVMTDLSNRYVASVCYWIMSGNSPGSHENSVLVDKDAPVNIDTRLTDFTINEARLRVPPAMMSRKINVALNPDMTVTEAGFRSGVIQMDVTNNLPLEMTLQLTIYEFSRKSTLEPLSWQIHMSPLQHKMTEIDLSDYILRLSEPQSATVQNITLHLKGGSLSSTAGLVNLNAQNAIKVMFSFRNSIIDYFKGRMQEQEISFDSTHKEIKLPGELGSLNGISFGIARMQLKIYNTIQMPFRFNSMITGYNEEGERVRFHVDERIPASSGGEAVAHVPEFTPENSTILNFMNLLPTRYVVSGTAFIGDGMTSGTVRSTDHVRAIFQFESGAKVKFNGRSVHIDTTKLFIEPENFQGKVPDDEKSISAEITDKLLSIQMMAHIHNHLPIGCQLNFILCEDSTRLHSDPDVTIGPANLIPAEVDDQGRVIKTTEQDVTLSVPEDDIWIFQNDNESLKKIFIATDLFVPGTNGKMIQLFGSDFIEVQTLAQFKLLIEVD